MGLKTVQGSSRRKGLGLNREGVKTFAEWVICSSVGLADGWARAVKWHKAWTNCIDRIFNHGLTHEKLNKSYGWTHSKWKCTCMLM